MAALKALRHPPIRSSDEVLTNFYANLRNREAFRVILTIEGFAFIFRRLFWKEFCLSSFVGFLSAVLLVGLALILPVCIVAAVVRAISATGRQDQAVR
jgi:hypothetical protein